ncbi:vacuolar protein sorting-associated protein 45-like [Paramacrobiotus metropolitanus]|uniref:vacuolar protein sorting-associated protein 45-like n=1 Tax=Paramacrobiotus metropolitanus TaxID=2943436 RepID=UPI002445BF46|nr:vacuolar protein sorting-associated protein 45-like [Paramacrobiotus metropolitanus]
MIAKMDILLAVRMYIDKMIEESGPGMKVMLMDKETISMVSVVYAQSELLRKEMYLFERIDGGGSREPMKHLKCIVFLRPTRENVDNLCHEFKFPKYGSYYVYFSNIIPKTDIKQLAECDEQEIVKEIQEFYGDYIAISPHVFSLNISNIYHQYNWIPETLNRVMQGLSSVLLALQKAPLIRYQNSSEMAHRLAERIRQLMAKESSLFDFRPSGAPQSVLLILDRREDSVTPLLNQWTYQAMVHELLGIHNNRVSLADVPNVSREMQEVVLSGEQDEFYATNRYSNFGEIATSIKQLMEEYQTKAKMQTKVESITDMKNFIENYPQFKKISGTVSKHVTVIGELSRLVAQNELLQISELEQEIVAGQLDHSDCFQRIRQLIGNPKVPVLDALRLVLLYTLRFEKDPSRDSHTFTDLLRRKGASERWVQLPEKITSFGGTRFRLSDLFNSETVSADAFMRRLTKGIRGVENIYTQHNPLVRDLVDQVIKGRLREPSYPYLGGVQLRERPQDVFIFVLGGITYEEAYSIHELNKLNPMCRIVIGGTTVHNTKSFLDEVFNADQP